MFAFRNQTMQMLSASIRALGAEHFEDEGRKRRVREILKDIPEEDYNNDITLPPAWVGKIINDIWNS